MSKLKQYLTQYTIEFTLAALAISVLAILIALS